jgi:alcohol dehydrogenase (NADP+)
VKVGKNVKHIKLGDRVGLGAQAGSCLDCEECVAGLEPYCSKGQVGTYNAQYPDGSKSYGGYADYCRAPGHFIVKIPNGLTLAEAAPMLCGGVTVWSPLKKNGAGPGKRVGIVGIGGLGHFGLLWAKALGCDEVVAISRTSSKAADAKNMGADRFIATDEDEGWAKKNSRSLDLIVSTVSSPNMPLTGYFRLLKTYGQFIQVSISWVLTAGAQMLTYPPGRSSRRRISPIQRHGPYRKGLQIGRVKHWLSGGYF